MDEVKKMKILAIGNSFSQDATRYLRQIADADGTPLKIVNLYIGGCSLRTHYLNMLDDEKAYSMEYSGEATGFYVSIREALKSDHWDIVTLQQVSQESPYADTYEPYLTELADYVRTYAPDARLYIHQTWAYEEGSDRLTKELGYTTHTDMFRDLKEAYRQAAASIDAFGIIPSGEAMENLLALGIPKVHRDTFHVTFGLARYTLGLLWYEVLTGKNPEKNTFQNFDEPVTPEEMEIAKKAAHMAAESYK